MCLAKAWHTGAAYVYHFEKPNPWEGRWQGKASHLTDLAYLLHNFDSFLSKEQVAIGTGFSRGLLAFVSGKTPWPPLTNDGEPFVKVFGDTTTSGSQSISVSQIMDQVGADRLSEIFEQFIAKGLA